VSDTDSGGLVVKYVLALIACVSIVIVYALIGAALGWKRGGGIIPMMLLCAALPAAWRAITK